MNCVVSRAAPICIRKVDALAVQRVNCNREIVADEPFLPEVREM